MLVGLEPRLAGAQQRVHHLAVHVELELLRRGVADPHRLRSLVARQPVELQLGQPPLARAAVHDLDVARVAGDRAQQPVAPRARLVLEAAAEQRHQRERGVAQPAEAVVPVAHAAELLGQRRRGGGDDAAGGRVGERLQRQQRAAHERVVGVAAAHPRAPPRRTCPSTAAAASTGAGSATCDGYQVMTNGTSSPGPTANRRPRRQVLPVHRHAGVDPDGVRARRPPGGTRASGGPTAPRCP